MGVLCLQVIDALVIPSCFAMDDEKITSNEPLVPTHLSASNQVIRFDAHTTQDSEFKTHKKENPKSKKIVGEYIDFEEVED